MKFQIGYKKRCNTHGKGQKQKEFPFSCLFKQVYEREKGNTKEIKQEICDMRE